MDFDSHKNFAIGHIAAAPSPATSGHTFVLQAGDGQFFDTDMPCTLAPDGVMPTYDNAEIGYITAVSGDTLTVLRAQEGTLPKGVQVGWAIYGTVTAKTIQDIESAVAGADKYYHVDFTTQSGWLTVTHNLNKRPSVTIVDSAGSEVETDIIYLDDNTIELDLAGGFAGSVFCN